MSSDEVNSSKFDVVITGQATNLTLPVTAPVSHNEKLAKFIGENFKMWQQNMLFYLTMLNLAKYLKDDPPTVKEGEVDPVTAFNAVEA